MTDEVMDVLQDIQKRLERIEQGIKGRGSSKELLYVTGKVASFAGKNAYGFYNVEIGERPNLVKLGTKDSKLADPLAVAFDQELVVTVGYVEVPNKKNPAWKDRFVESVQLHETPAGTSAENDEEPPF